MLSILSISFCIKLYNYPSGSSHIIEVNSKVALKNFVYRNLLRKDFAVGLFIPVD